ncbi:hypothetical protein BKA65DRAFT_578390 [Rhexocercosporidium sp. MPI-PUGE-AT-0058]|nr:hypothetical protein BKA65DRAFT_578390 [Rhexocercosporidium sp. MPI-PUGE-AT-0058]
MATNVETIVLHALTRLVSRGDLDEVSFDLINPIQDRFTTTWAGPTEPRTIAFGIWIKNIEEIEDKKSGVITYVCNAKYLDASYRRRMNMASDEIHRYEHAQDQFLHTGTGSGDKKEWEDKTRGEKLRYLYLPLLGFDDLAGILHSVVGEIEGGLKSPLSEVAGLVVGLANMGGIGIQEVVEALKNDKQWLRVIKKHLQAMKAMVERETEDGWDWVVGLEKQVEHFNVTRLAWKQFSSYFWHLLGRGCGSSSDIQRDVLTMVGNGAE